MTRVFTVIAALGLAGCETAQTIAPQVSINGPIFSPSQFDCGDRPLPPSAVVAAGANAGVSTARHINDLGTWGQRCSNKLQSVGGQLEAAGQVVSGE